jgi:hypothetical protein
VSSSGAAGHLGLAMCLRDGARQHISAGWLRAGADGARQLDGGADGRKEGLRVGVWGRGETGRRGAGTPPRLGLQWRLQRGTRRRRQREQRRRRPGRSGEHERRSSSGALQKLALS